MTAPASTFTKRRADAPDGFFAVEAAGLAWLAAAGGCPVARVVEVHRDRIVLERISESAPSVAAAESLGRGLAALHRAGAAYHGCPPGDWRGDGFIASLPLPHRDVDDGQGWAAFYAEARIAPYLRLAADRGALDGRGVTTVERVMARLLDGSLADDVAEPARLHGDLWQGNVLWSADGAVLVDPAAHGGNRETDLAMLDLFGLPHLDRVLASYDEVWPLDDGWRERVPLHQVHPLLVHSALFGGGYGTQAVAAADRFA